MCKECLLTMTGMELSHRTMSNGAGVADEYSAGNMSMHSCPFSAGVTSHRRRVRRAQSSLRFGCESSTTSVRTVFDPTALVLPLCDRELSGSRDDRRNVPCL